MREAHVIGAHNKQMHKDGDDQILALWYLKARVLVSFTNSFQSFCNNIVISNRIQSIQKNKQKDAMDTVDHFNIKLSQDFPVHKTLLEVAFQISLNLHKNGQMPSKKLMASS